MFLILKLLLTFCFAGLCYAKSEAEIREYFLNLGLECNKEIPIPPEDMMSLHEHKIPDNENAKCFLACVYRKAKWLNDKGMLDTDTVHVIMEKEHDDDQDKFIKTKKLIDICKKVNDATVTDGEKGCQRSALLTNCLTENAPKMGLGTGITK